jgi:hypothetical protein
MSLLATKFERPIALAEFCLSAFLLLLPVATVASAGELPAVTIRTDQRDPYLAEGIGTGVRDASSAATKDYDLKLAFATTSDDALMAYTTVRILDTRGNEVLHVDNAGPWFFTNLSNGSYRVSATAYGRAIEQTAKINNGEQTKLFFYW